MAQEDFVRNRDMRKQWILGVFMLGQLKTGKPWKDKPGRSVCGKCRHQGTRARPAPSDPSQCPLSPSSGQGGHPHGRVSRPTSGEGPKVLPVSSQSNQYAKMPYFGVLHPDLHCSQINQCPISPDLRFLVRVSVHAKEVDRRCLRRKETYYNTYF